MTRKIVAVLITSVAAFLLTSCAVTPDGLLLTKAGSFGLFSGVKDADLISVTHQAADSMIKSIKESDGENVSSMLKDTVNSLARGGTVIAASFVNIDNLEESSSFGRIVSRQMATQFSARGYHVIELLLRKNVYIESKSGEFLLSRELSNIGAEYNAHALLVGTYAVGSKSVYVTARLVDAKSSIVIASSDFDVPLGPNTQTLISSKIVEGSSS